MKIRAIIFAITLTAMFFIPMTAITEPKKPAKAHSLPSAADSTSAENGADGISIEPSEGFRIYDLTSKEIYTVPLHDYVCGAIAAEMGADFEFEALVAQGCAALSCALYQKNAHANADYDFTADPKNRYMFLTEAQAREIYGSAFDEKWGKIRLAAEEAEKYIITYDGEAAMTVYHAISAGITQSAADLWGGDLLYLTEVESPLDADCEGFASTAVRPFDEVLESLNSCGAKLSGTSPEQWFSGGEYTSGGYLKRIEIGSATFSGAKLRTLFGLRSAAFTVTYSNGEFTFTVHGYGHGVGMSQVGANQMAKGGATAKEILAHYYPHTELAAA